ncbi:MULTISPECIES: SDR family NAD(P)-dependent oxidoreductase [Frankia]|uniref:Oxidoreductase, short-chain dehydrogenase/reductase n=2 Tax=Frankia TaxID=1854 RepID=Q0RIK0_FRAAA|nr:MULTISPECIES: SDR family oxidoreductase [Frankia]CAJ62668.1 Putative oxidoreductase, short-chain dehydrogenase/reductase [Frankia alni ACN14a]
MSAQRLSGKVALITGGTRGIGREFVERFAREGASVVFTGRSVDAGSQIEQEAKARGENVTFAAGSAASEDDVRAAVELAVSTYGSLTTVVNNAAATHLTGPGRPDTKVADVSTEVFDEIVRIGLYGTFWAAKYAIPHLIAAGGGAIINISAASSVLSITGRPSYQSSKGAINSLTRQIAVDYGQYGIRSNAIIVGFTNTGGEEMTKMVANEALMAPVRKTIMLPRLGLSSDIASGAVFLASDEGSFITGVLLPIDGGLTCHLEMPDTASAAALGD